MDPGFFVFVALSSGLSGTAWVRQRYRCDRARRWGSAWQRVAADRGGRFRFAQVPVLREAPPRRYSRGWWQARPVARARAMDVPVLEVGRADGGGADGGGEDGRGPLTARVAVGDTVGFRTFFEAEFSLGVGPAFVLRDGELVEGDAALVAAAVPASIGAELAAIVPGARIDSNGVVVSVMAEGFCRTEEELVVGLDAAQAIADSDAYGVRALGALPEATPIDRDPVTELPAVELRLPEPVRVGPRRCGAGARTSARAAASSAIDLRFEVGSAGGAPAPVPDTLPREAVPQLERAGEGVLVSHAGRVAFEWAGIERDRGRLLAGARGVAAVARGLGRAVYR